MGYWRIFFEKRARDSNNDRTSLGDTTQVEYLCPIVQGSQGKYPSTATRTFSQKTFANVETPLEQTVAQNGIDSFDSGPSQ
jgi:hypothetical protein